MTAHRNQASSSWRSAALMVVTAIALAGCVAAGSGSASASPSAPGATSSLPQAPTTQPAASSGSVSASGFYLRAWQTQALAPQETFGWLPATTVSGGEFIDGMVAVPAIYPGPLWIGPSVRTISTAGIDSIVAEARRLGLLGTKADFTAGSMPGSVTGHIQLVVNGTTYDLTGSPDVGQTLQTPAPGSAAAFVAFWGDIGGLAMWLPADLGQSAPYEPDRLAVLAVPPQQTSGITPSEVPWPLSTPFAAFGVPFGGNATRCAVVSGADLAKLEPVVRQANQLTRFADAAGIRDSLQVRVMVPGEPNPCG